jgi:hypothetical protein
MSLPAKIFSGMKTKSPWWIKIPFKITLSRLPVNYTTWSKIGYFKHGYMMNPDYAFRVFKRHYDYVSSRVSLKRYTVLEMGVGDSLFTAIVAYAFGASRCYLIDTSDYASRNISAYKKMVQYISEKELPVPDTKEADTLNDLLVKCNACYETKGLESLRSIPDKSVDFIFSQAVFEHIRKQELPETLKQLRRIITDRGVCSHSIDLKDHLGGNLNSLRFSDNIWESDFFAKSGFYTNRIRYGKMLELFKEAEFRPEIVRTKRWPELPTSRKKLASEFNFLPDSELNISEFDVLLFPD